MGSSLSNPANNLSEGINRIEWEYGHNDTKCGTCGIKHKYCNCFLEYTNFKADIIEYKCLCFNKNCQQKFDGKLKEQSLNTYKYSNDENNKRISILQKGVYPY